MTSRRLAAALIAATALALTGCIPTPHTLGLSAHPYTVPQQEPERLEPPAPFSLDTAARGCSPDGVGFDVQNELQMTIRAWTGLELAGVQQPADTTDLDGAICAMRLLGMDDEGEAMLLRSVDLTGVGYSIGWDSHFATTTYEPGIGVLNIVVTRSRY